MDPPILQTTLGHDRVSVSSPLQRRDVVESPSSLRSPVLERRPARYPIDLSSNFSSLSPRIAGKSRNELPRSTPSSPLSSRKVSMANETPLVPSSPLVSRKSEVSGATFADLSKVLAPPTHALAELTSLDELSFPTNTSRRIKYTCVSVSPRFLVLGTSTGTVYVFSRFASKHRTKFTPLPVNVFTTKDGPVNTLLIGPSEGHVAVGSDSGRVSVATLQATTQSVGNTTPAIVLSVPGDARHPDRVSVLAWSEDSNTLFVGHQSGRVNAHRINARSVFRSSCDQLCHLDGDIVQIDFSCAGKGVLLVSTLTGSHVVETERRGTSQIGTKSRTEYMGACFIDSSDDSFVLAARPNGRLWEANRAGTVYRTHQLRQSERFPIVPAVSFRDPFPNMPQMDPQSVKTEIGFCKLHRITVDNHTMVLSVYEGQKMVLVDLENSPSRVVLASNLGNEICDFAICGSDIFVLFAGHGELKKFTVFTVEKAVEKLIFKNSFVQAAHLCIYLSEWTESRERVDREAAEKIMEGLGTISRTKETEWLRNQLSEAYLGSAASSADSTRNVHFVNVQTADLQPGSTQTRPPPSPRMINRKGRSQKMVTGIHRVVAERMENSGYEDDFVFRLSAPLRERSKSSPCFDKRFGAPSTSTQASKRQSLPLTTEEIEELEKTHSREGTPDNPFERARRLLEHSTSLPDGGALRTILGLDDDSVMGIEFTPTITWANAPRTLAELARMVPVQIPDEELKVEHGSVKRTVVPSTGVRRGAKVVKSIRPVKKTVGRTPMPNRVMEVRTSPIPPDPESKRSSTKSTPSSSMRRSPLIEKDSKEIRQQANNGDEETLDSLQKRLSELLNNEKAGSPTVAAVMDSAANVEDNSNRHCCAACGIHRSWLALALFSPVVKRLRISEGMFEHGGVPSSWSEWSKLLTSRIVSERDTQCKGVPICQKCRTTLERVSDIPVSARSRIRHSPPKVPIDKERIRQKVINLSNETLTDVLFGEKSSREKEYKVTTPTAVVPPNGHLGMVESLPNGFEWLQMVDSEVLLILCSLAMDVGSLIQNLNATSSTLLRSVMTDSHWALVSHMKASDLIKRNAQPRVSGKIISSLSDEFNLAEYICIEENTSPVKDIHRRSSQPIGSSRPVPTSWIADLGRSCPVCTLPLKTVVGGKDAGAISYSCGHTYHVMCTRESSACVACRVRMRSRIAARK